jgi:hypothetical protein
MKAYTDLQRGHLFLRPDSVSEAGTIWKDGAEMNIIERIVDGFIMTVGITPPKPERRRTAVIFIAAGLVGTVVGVVVLVSIVIHRLSAH